MRSPSVEPLRADAGSRHLPLTQPRIVLHYLGMGTRVKEPVVRRPSLPLTEEDDAALARMRSSEPSLKALQALTGVDATSATEAALLQAILRSGLRAIAEEVERSGYAELADDYRRDSDERRARARRRPPAWAQEP